MNFAYDDCSDRVMIGSRIIVWLVGMQLNTTTSFSAYLTKNVLFLGMPDHLKNFQGHFVFQDIRWTIFMGAYRRQNGFLPPGNWE